MTETLEEENVQRKGCGIIGRYPIISILVFAALGIGTGIGLSYWQPEDDDEANRKNEVLRWIGLIGDLFIRALKAIVLPLVFINVSISLVDMMSLGRASRIGWTTIGLYFLTTIAAAIIGIVCIIIFRSKFVTETFEEDGPAVVTLGCGIPGTYIAEGEGGTLSCTADFASEEDILFEFDDVTNDLVKASGGTQSDLSMSETIYQGIFMKLVTSNIFVAFYDGNFAAVAFFAIFFGFALGRILQQQQIAEADSSVMRLFRELDKVFILLINWIILATPFAVWSLISKAIGRNNDLKDNFTNVGYLVGATVLAMFLHYCLFYLGVFWLFTRINVFKYMKSIVPAQTMAFASASSAATIPVTLRSVMDTGIVPEQIARFVIPLGATINMDGGAIYFPCACIWLAYLNGETINVGNYFLLIAIATIGSAGTAPVPSASLVLIITAYNTVFNTVGVPNGFEYILAIDWFMDRLRTTLNVTGDSVVTGIVATRTPREDFDHLHDDDMEKAHHAPPAKSSTHMMSIDDTDDSPPEAAGSDSVEEEGDEYADAQPDHVPEYHTTLNPDRSLHA